MRYSENEAYLNQLRYQTHLSSTLAVTTAPAVLSSSAPLNSTWISGPTEIVHQNSLSHLKSEDKAVDAAELNSYMALILKEGDVVDRSQDFTLAEGDQLTSLSRQLDSLSELSEKMSFVMREVQYLLNG